MTKNKHCVKNKRNLTVNQPVSIIQCASCGGQYNFKPVHKDRYNFKGALALFRTEALGSYSRGHKQSTVD